MKTSVFFLALIFPFLLNAQFTKFAGGLGFSSGVSYNLNETANPAIWARAYYKLSKKAFVAPTFSFYKSGINSNFEYELKNYMMQGDIDLNYGLFKEDDISLFAFTGLNATSVISRFRLKEDSGGDYPEDKSDIRLGLNVGAALEMRVDDYFDAFLSCKYIAGSWSQLVVSLGVIYNLEGKRRRGW